MTLPGEPRRRARPLDDRRDAPAAAPAPRVVTARPCSPMATVAWTAGRRDERPAPRAVSVARSVRAERALAGAPGRRPRRAWRPSAARPPRGDPALRPSREDALHLTARASSASARSTRSTPHARPCAPWPARRRRCSSLARPAVAGARAARTCSRWRLEDADGVLARPAGPRRRAPGRRAGAGSPRSGRFRPHVTVARVRRELAAAGRRPAPRPRRRPSTADAVVLMRSHLGGRGPSRYEPLERVQLAS